MSTLISPATLRQHFETDYTDEALQLVIDAEDAEIIRAHGPLANISEIFRDAPEHLWIARPASAIVSVSQDYPTGTIVALVASDYLVRNGQQITRLDSGTNPLGQWYGVVTVTYTPEDDAARRKMALIDLCKLRLQFKGLDAESDGSYSRSQNAYMANRRMILGSLFRGISLR